MKSLIHKNFFLWKKKHRIISGSAWLIKFSSFIISTKEKWFLHKEIGNGHTKTPRQRKIKPKKKKTKPIISVWVYTTPPIFSLVFLLKRKKTKAKDFKKKKRAKQEPQKKNDDVVKGGEETTVVLSVLLPLPAGGKKLIKSSIYMYIYIYLPIYAEGKKKRW